MIGAILACLFLASALYALFLQTPVGRRIAARRTWVTVVVGNGLILAALYALLPLETWLIVGAAFVAAGAPIVARSLHNEMRDEDASLRTVRGE